MKTEKWLKGKGYDFEGKVVAVTGATGGIGNQLCMTFAGLGAKLMLIDRNLSKSLAVKEMVLGRYPDAVVDNLYMDLANLDTVKVAVEKMKELKIDYLILNSGVYAVPRYKTDLGFDNVFQINFVSNYFLIKELISTFEKNGTKVVAVGSIAHTYSKLDENDIDFSQREKSNLVYGNSKRFLMFALDELLKKHSKVGFAIAHPGITSTNITAHYPKVIYEIIKYPMKVVFMRPKKACLSIVEACAENCDYGEWFGPKIAGIWGCPKKSRLDDCSEQEKHKIFEIAEKIYDDIKNK